LCKMRRDLIKLNVPSDHSVYNILLLDIEISAMGIIDYFTKQEKANSTIN
ncbi:MBL fold metallo-hydrolase, partial [Bacillus sp. D-CC]